LLYKTKDHHFTTLTKTMTFYVAEHEGKFT